MPLWLDMLTTPMAAPECAALRRMRRTWQLLCIATALSVGFIGQIALLFGNLAIAVAAGLLIAMPLYTCLYLARKRRADERYLEQLGEAK